MARTQKPQTRMTLRSLWMWFHPNGETIASMKLINPGFGHEYGGMSDTCALVALNCLIRCYQMVVTDASYDGKTELVLQYFRQHPEKLPFSKELVIQDTHYKFLEPHIVIYTPPPPPPLTLRRAGKTPRRLTLTLTRS
mgnify:CR=1 FL=1|jgi:hypothetical protein